MIYSRLIFLAALFESSISLPWAIPMNKDLPQDLYSYRLPETDPLPEEVIEVEPNNVEEAPEIVEDSAPPEESVNLDEVKELEERLQILKKRRDSIEKLNHIPEDSEQHTPPKDIDYGLENDVIGYSVDRYKIITADRYIPCITENSINSELPGRVIVVVERNVFAPKGRNIVIPKGARMICAYEKTKAGQTRLGLKCKRLINPNGSHMILSNMTASDVMGRGGVAAYVDNRFVEQFGAALMVAGIEGGISLGRSLLSKNEYLALLNNSSNSTSQQESSFVKITNKMLEKNGNLDPIIMVPSGTRLLMVPAKDIVMRPIEEMEKK